MRSECAEPDRRSGRLRCQHRSGDEVNFGVKILTPADTDAVEAAIWYESQVPGLGAEFMEEVNAAAQRLASYPEIHHICFETNSTRSLHWLDLVMSAAIGSRLFQSFS